jgi:hypothetical protein
MKDFLALQMPPLLDIPSESAVLGTLAHKVVEILYCGRERISENEARNAAGEIFDNLLPVMAAELLLPGKNSLKNRLKNVLKNAIYSLVKHINSMNLMVKACEKELHGSFEGTDFIGYCDLYLEDENGKPFVIDMKWST